MAERMGQACTPPPVVVVNVKYNVIPCKPTLFSRLINMLVRLFAPGRSVTVSLDTDAVNRKQTIRCRHIFEMGKVFFFVTFFFDVSLSVAHRAERGVRCRACRSSRRIVGSRTGHRSALTEHHNERARVLNDPFSRQLHFRECHLTPSRATCER